MLEKFIIGTANFGMAYGIMGRGQRLSDGLIREILSLSKNYKIKFLDTAPVYGDSEKIIGKIGVNGFGVTTKLHGLSNSNWSLIEQNIQKSMQDLRVTEPFDTILVHDPSELSGKRFILTHENLLKLKEKGYAKKIGLSIYSDDQLAGIKNYFVPDVVQVPVNLLDQRALNSLELIGLKELGCEIHARSIFLQGLLAMGIYNRPSTLSTDLTDLKRVYQYSDMANISVRKLALNWILSQPFLDKIVVGVESVEQLNQIVADIDEGLHLDFDHISSLASHNVELIEPYRW